MINQETVNAALQWYETGVRRIGNETINLGLTYLDKAIAVFAEVGDLRMLSYARHHKLLGFKLDQRDEEVESLFADVMQGYTRLEDNYGKALLLTHLAESLAHRGLWTRSTSFFNLALVLAENDRLVPLVVYVLEQQGRMYRQRENQIRAIHFFQQAEDLASREDMAVVFTRCRQLRAETLVELGETSEAVALVEDVQSRLIEERRFREALDALSLLRRLYTDAEMEEDTSRAIRLIHACGQELLRTDSVPKPSIYEGPAIEHPA